MAAPAPLTLYKARRLPTATYRQLGAPASTGRPALQPPGCGQDAGPRMDGYLGICPVDSPPTAARPPSQRTRRPLALAATARAALRRRRNQPKRTRLGVAISGSRPTTRTQHAARLGGSAARLLAARAAPVRNAAARVPLRSFTAARLLASRAASVRTAAARAPRRSFTTARLLAARAAPCAMQRPVLPCAALPQPGSLQALYFHCGFSATGFGAVRAS